MEFLAVELSHYRGFTRTVDPINTLYLKWNLMTPVRTHDPHRQVVLESLAPRPPTVMIVLSIN